MSVASLLIWDSREMQDPVFSFEHFMSHQRISAGSAQRQLHPGANDNGMWHRNHQETHDYMDVGTAYNIEDYSLTNKAQRRWWLFQNHYAHLNAEP